MKIWPAAGAASILLTAGFAVPVSADETQTYSYDALQRLISVQYSGTINDNQAHSICYDPAGNRSRYRSSPTGVVSICAVPGAATSGGDGLLDLEFLSAEESSGEGPPAEDAYPPSEDVPAGESLPDIPPVAEDGPVGVNPVDGALPPDPPPGGDEPPAEPPEGEGPGQ